MPLGMASHISPGDELPAYSELLSTGRFVLRSKLVRKQATQLFEHPLFLDIVAARLPQRAQAGREIALTWEKATSQYHDANPIPVTEQSRDGFVLSHGGSSMGNLDKILPRTYSGSRATVRVYSSTGAFRCMPMDLHPKSSTFDNKLLLDVYWDKNTYDEPTIAEWLEDMVEATKHYLGGEIE
ncbi:hypothetical protein AX15_005174 [Amanita polypyramis BW_CC]|nr:hypothetical protein AX15_005174 [Amanita polypyramis BW_CC]